MANLIRHLFIGVDGGATKTIVRVEDENGGLLGVEAGDSANIRLSVAQAWASIMAALNKTLMKQQIDLAKVRMHAVMGLAGSEVREAYEAFLAVAHPFESLEVMSDAAIACVGAHQGKDGAIIIAGTGSIGFQIENGQTTRVGGWGFPHDDEGGGAWLGLCAVRLALQSLDGRLPASPLSDAVYQHFKCKQDEFVAWANAANSTGFAQIAPIVIAASQAGDVQAIQLLKFAAAALDSIAFALQKAQHHQAPLPCSLIGGLASFLAPYLNESLQTRLRAPTLSPDAGAALLAHQKELS